MQETSGGLLGSLRTFGIQYKKELHFSFHLWKLLEKNCALANYLRTHSSADPVKPHQTLSWVLVLQIHPALQCRGWAQDYSSHWYGRETHCGLTTFWKTSLTRAPPVGNRGMGEPQYTSCSLHQNLGAANQIVCGLKCHLLW